MVKDWVAVIDGRPVAALATCTVKLDVPAVVGVPLNTPAAENVRPGGSVPPVKDHV
jgi:hypothetical protein